MGPRRQRLQLYLRFNLDFGFPSGATRFTRLGRLAGIHRSTDCGKTWTGPFEVLPASNPNVSLPPASAFDGSDKEFMT